ncbi:MAG: hypothetical protein V3S16_06230 [Candidatus Desulfatibia sp.]|uniref:hypothetical protein n=1 Tax=Candidatus Desulfatibia sp. TaxID=3101189 RepID=UPI002F3423C0
MKRDYIEKWRIVEMEHWDKDYIDLVVPGYIRFDKDGLGEFQFGVVYGSMDYRIENYSKFERIEFSWEGQDETNSVCGIRTILSLTLPAINPFLSVIRPPV